MRKVVLFALTLALVFIGFTPAMAQSQTVTITEQQINNSFVVAVNPSYAVSNTRVDLQPGKIVINATIVPRQGNTIEAQLVVVPVLDRGFLSWVVTEVLLNGQEAPDATVSQINTALLPTWRTLAATFVSPTLSVTAVEVTNTELKITLSSTVIEVTPEATPAAPDEEIFILTEAQANATISVLFGAARGISNEKIDFKPGKVVVSATLVPRRGSTIDVVMELLPEVTSTAITWKVNSILVGGQPAPAATVNLVNESITNRWARYIRQQTPEGGAKKLEITEDQMIFTLD